MAASFVWLPSAARTTTQTSQDISTAGFNHLTVTVDSTVIGSASLTLTINGKDMASGKYRLLLSSAAITSNTTTAYRVTQFVAASANSSAIDVLPEFVQLVMTAGNANPATYSIGYDLS